MSRYQNLDTHVIDTSKSFISTREFQNLKDLNVVGKIPTNTGVYIFIIDVNDNLNYAFFKSTDNETFDGRYKSISPEIKFDDATNINIMGSYYSTNKLFYVFYNRNNNLYVRTFHNDTFLGEELLVYENIVLEKIERVKENYMMTVLDITHAPLFSKVSKLGEGLYKLLFLYEIDIEQLESRQTTIMNVQLLDIPFGDIGEDLWTDTNMVHNNKGYLYMSNSNVISVFDNKSINGSVFFNPGRTIMELNKDTDQYTFTMRFKPSTPSTGYKYLLEANNYHIEYNSTDIKIYAHNSKERTFAVSLDPTEFYNISIISSITPESYIFKVYLSNESFNGTKNFTINYPKIESPNEVDSIMTIDNVASLDYISVQNASLPHTVVLDIHNSFEKRLLSDTSNKTIQVNYKTIVGMLFSDPDRTTFPFFESNKYVSKINIKCNSSLSLNIDSLFLDNENGSIIDYNLNLMWAYTPEVIPPDWNNMWKRADNKASNSKFLDYSDWRLPTLDETLSLATSINDDPSLLNIFDFTSILNNPTYPGIVWTSTIESISGSIENYYYYDFLNMTTGVGNSVEDNINNVLMIREYSDFSIQFDDKTIYNLPVIKGEEINIVKTGIPTFTRNIKNDKYNAYDIVISYNIIRVVEDLEYPNEYALNNALEYHKGTYLNVNHVTNPLEMKSTVLPLYIPEELGINVFSNAEDSLRVCEHLSQRYSRVPFTLETAGDMKGFVIWTNISKFSGKIGIQYELNENNNGLRPSYQEYDTISYNTYPLDTYFCAYHFTDTVDNRRALITKLTIDNQGEIILGGKTVENSYLREISSINFFDNPQKYKTSEFDVSVDVLRNLDRESYINNIDSIKLFISNIIDLWKPATSSVRGIVEKNTLIMAQLLKDEFTQVLVGLTPKSNTNAFYIRSLENGQISIGTASNAIGDAVDWIGVGTLNTPYIKSGVVKIKDKKVQTKIFFETRFQNSFYRVFVFTPNNNNYFVSSKDKDGFIVESSSFVEKEVAWIALDTNQVVNGTINWTRGLPVAQKLVNHLDRQQEVNINSSRYTVDLTSLGFPPFEDDTYSVILTPSTNVNLWVEKKTTTTFDIRRSYAGEDTQIHFMAVAGNSKWWNNITA